MTRKQKENTGMIIMGLGLLFIGINWIYPWIVFKIIAICLFAINLAVNVFVKPK